MEGRYPRSLILIDANDESLQSRGLYYHERSSDWIWMSVFTSTTTSGSERRDVVALAWVTQSLYNGCEANIVSPNTTHQKTWSQEVPRKHNNNKIHKQKN